MANVCTPRRAALLLPLIAGAMLSRPADAQTLRQCTRACADEVAACLADGETKRVCNLATARCRDEGFDACLNPGEPLPSGRAGRRGPLLPPTDVTAYASGGSVALAWSDPNTAEVGYAIERSGSADGGFARVGTTGRDVTTFVDATGLPAYYRVRALGKRGRVSAYSGVVAATTDPPDPPAPPPSAEGLLGFVPDVGSAKDVLVDRARGLAYVASVQFGLAVVDVSTPAAPIAIAGAVPPFYGEQVAVDGALAVVSGNAAGLRVVDVSVPTAPRTVGLVPGTIKDVARAGRYAYALLVIPGNPESTDLVVVDLADPSAPVIAARLRLAGGLGLELQGSLAYVAAGTAGLQVVSVADPLAPSLLGTVNTPGTAYAVTVSNGYAYVADDGTLRVVDVRTPSRPALAGSLAVPATALRLNGTRLHVIGGTLHRIVDVSTPGAPVVMGSASAYGAQGVDADGAIAYLASPEVDAGRGTGGLYAIDVSSPSAPRSLTNVFAGFDNTGVALAGSLAVVTGNALGLRVLDAATPAAPRVLGTLPGTMSGVALGGRYAYVLLVVAGNPSHTELAVVDLASPSTPTLRGRAVLGGGLGVTLAGTLAYVAAGDAGVQIVDVANPDAPRVVGTANTPGRARGIALVGTHAYVADESALVVVDVADRTRPAVRASLATPALAVAPDGNRVFALADNRLHVVDVANPIAPQVIGTADAAGAQAIVAAGGRAFVATPALNHYDATGGVDVFDVTNPAAPQRLRHVVVPGTTRTVAYAGGLVYAGDSAATLDVIDVTD
jgi:hypothetical protein